MTVARFLGRRRVFAALNVLVALLFGGGTLALPVRYWALDVPVLVVVLAVLGASVAAFTERGFAERALRVGAWVLLGFGLFFLTLVVLSMAFLWGVHGEYGNYGILMVVLILALVLPYTVVLPVVELVGSYRAGRGSELGA